MFNNLNANQRAEVLSKLPRQRKGKGGKVFYPSNKTMVKRVHKVSGLVEYFMAKNTARECHNAAYWNSQPNAAMQYEYYDVANIDAEIEAIAHRLYSNVPAVELPKFEEEPRALHERPEPKPDAKIEALEEKVSKLSDMLGQVLEAMKPKEKKAKPEPKPEPPTE